MTSKFLIGYDGSPASKRAADFALNSARTHGASLVIAHVLEWSPYSFLTPEEIEELSLSQLFILRTVVQLELALLPEIERATQLPFKEVEDAMRFCSSRGYVEPFQGGYRMTWPWYRTITTVLQRQHLLSSL